MNNPKIDAQALINVLANQRNAATDNAANLEAYVATLKAEVAKRDERIAALEGQIQTEATNDKQAGKDWPEPVDPHKQNGLPTADDPLAEIDRVISEGQHA